jgi:CheY-like chemotaxis protein
VNSNLILLAEDSEEDELLFMNALQNSGIRNPVIVVTDGRQVIAYLNGELQYADRSRFPLPRILMLDLAMPKLDGWQVLQWVRARPEFADLLVVVLTNSLRADDLQRAYRMGANSFLGKPCTSAELLNLQQAYPAHWTRPAEAV